MPTIYETALEYTRQGLRVIPISPNEKIPPKNFSVSEIAKRPMTDDELRHWFASDDMNIAALMQSSGLLLVDADAYKTDLTSLITELEKTTHLRAQSARGGYHFFYKTDNGLDTQNVIAPAVDTKFKGYALLPPSKIDGKPYQWIERGEPGIPPAFILRKFADKREIEIPQTDSLSLISQVITNGFTPGQHNKELLDMARLLTRAMETDNEEFKKQVLYELMKALDDRDPSPQQKAGNFLPTLKSAWEYETRKKVEKPLATSQDDLMVLDDLGQMAATYSNYQLTYLVDQWLPENAILLMSGPPEAGKTWLLLDMAISLAFGNKDRAGFMGQFQTPNAPTPVLVIQQEDFPGQVFQRMQTIMAQKLRDAAWKFEATENGWIIEHPGLAPIYMHNHAQLRFDNPVAMQALENWIKETGAKAVFIDPLYTLGSSDNYFADIVPYFSELKRMRNTYGVSFVIAHHNRKSGGDGRSQVYGSVLLNAASEGVILLEKLEDQSLRLSRSGKFFPGSISYKIAFDIDTEAGRYIVNVGDDFDSSGKYEGPIVRLITELGPQSQKELAEELDAPQPSISHTLTRLVKSGKLVKEKRKYALGVDTNDF